MDPGQEDPAGVNKSRRRGNTISSVTQTQGPGLPGQLLVMLWDVHHLHVYGEPATECGSVAYMRTWGLCIVASLPTSGSYPGLQEETMVTSLSSSTQTRRRRKLQEGKDVLRVKRKSQAVSFPGPCTLGRGPGELWN